MLSRKYVLWFERESFVCAKKVVAIPREYLGAMPDSPIRSKENCHRLDVCRHD